MLGAWEWSNISNVPETLHRQLKSRAALAGMSLSDYLLGEMRQVAERPTIEEMRSAPARRPETRRSFGGRRGSRRTRSDVIVVDASALLEALLQTPARPR